MVLELPGLFDLQVNGFAGVDFNAPELDSDRVVAATERLRATGVTRFLPTLITSSLRQFTASARVLARVRHRAIAGIHLEGPYLSAEDGPRGAHPIAHISPATIGDFERRQEAADGRIVLVTLAPEVPGALSLIAHLAHAGVRVSIGHTAATPSQVADAVSAGATLFTHLGNGCAHLVPRHPNVLWEALATDALSASFIVDGHHLPPATVKAMIRAKEPARTILVTDAIAAAGCGPGRYTIGSVACTADGDGRVSLPGTPYLAGSSLTMERAMANTVRFTGLPLERVVPMASANPAALVGLEPAGTIEVEWDAGAGELRTLHVWE